MKELRDRVCVITGAGNGIGRGLAHAFALRGARLLLADVDEAGLAQTRGELGDRAAVVTRRTDVSRPDDLDALARVARDEFGAAHVLCNNAGVGVIGTSWSTPVEDWQRILAVNVIGVVNGLRSFVPMLLEQGVEAHVVNTASIMGLLTTPFQGAYAASKHAVVALSESLRGELLATGKPVGVSVVCPGPVRTRMIDEARTDFNDPAVKATLAAIQTVTREQGMSPRAVAESVVDAVLANRFWVFPAPEFLPEELPRQAEIRAARPSFG
jgi:NAD(P)-dependent dehydrogenase (short-subunit alcohol dehydrogenase family)